MLLRQNELEEKKIRLSEQIDKGKMIEKENKRLVVELKDAQNKVEILAEFLPICVNCKKIRDDQGYWRLVEGYVKDHSKEKLPFGVCPNCAQFHKVKE